MLNFYELQQCVDKKTVLSKTKSIWCEFHRIWLLSQGTLTILFPFYFFSLSFSKREREHLMVWCCLFISRAKNVTPSRRRKMANLNNTNPYNGSDSPAIKQSGSQAFKISLTPTLQQSGRWVADLRAVNHATVPAGAWAEYSRGHAVHQICVHTPQTSTARNTKKRQKRKTMHYWPTLN